MKFALFLSVLVWSATAGAGNLQSIYWRTDPQPCSSMAAPVVANPAWYPHCPTNALWSICPVSWYSGDPYNASQPITLIGWEITQVLSDPTASGAVIVGSASATPGADIFASGAGVGSWSKNGTLPLGLAQGGPLSNNAHIDIYDQCDRGTRQIIFVGLYSSP